MNNSKIGLALAVVIFLACLFLVKTEPASWNDSSRLAAIESLVEHGTWAIDDSTWRDFTKDKILIRDNFYSDKMPLFSVIGAGVYAGLRAFGGSVRMDCAQVGRFCAYAPLTLAVVALPAAILVYLFFDHATRLSVPRGSALIGSIAVTLGTMIFPYSLVLNHHVPAAAAIFASYYLLHRADRQARGEEYFSPRAAAPASYAASIFFAGFLAALAPAFDVLSGIIAATLFGIAAARGRARALYFILGGAIPLAATALLDLQIAHTILPPYMVTDAYNFPGSAFPATVGGNGTPDDYAAYAFRMFLGGKGLLAYNPLLILAFVGAVRVALNRGSALRVQAALTALGFIALCVYLATQTGNYGGTAYGERWFIVAIPILFSFIFSVPPLNSASRTPALRRPHAIPRDSKTLSGASGAAERERGARKNAWYLLLVPLLALSIISSLQGSQAPWQDWLPPLQMTRDVTKFPYLGFRWNLR